jgi:hypothetical protein
LYAHGFDFQGSVVLDVTREANDFTVYEWQLFCQHPGIQGIGGSLSAVDGYSTKISGGKKNIEVAFTHCYSKLCVSC